MRSCVVSVSVLFVFVCIQVCGRGNVWVQTQVCVCVCVCVGTCALWVLCGDPFFISTVVFGKLLECSFMYIWLYNTRVEVVFMTHVFVCSHLSLQYGDDHKLVYMLCTVYILQYL